MEVDARSPGLPLKNFFAPYTSGTNQQKIVHEGSPGEIDGTAREKTLI